jgi:hypothetical protein
MGRQREKARCLNAPRTDVAVSRTTLTDPAGDQTSFTFDFTNEINNIPPGSQTQIH